MKKLAVIVLCILAGSAVRAAEQPSKSPMPLAVGNKWEYSVSQIGVMTMDDGENSRAAQTSSAGTCVEEVLAVKERRPNGDAVFEHRSTTNTQEGENSEAKESVMDSLLLTSKDGIFITASKSSGLDGLLTNEWVNYQPPLMIYRIGMKAGTKWNVGTVREGKLRMPMMAKVVGTESVTVPAGTFADCLKMYVTCSKVSGTMGSGEDKAEIKDGKSVTAVWVCPGIGVVKEDSILQAKMQFPPDETGRAFIMTGTHRKIKSLQPGYVVK